MNLPKPANDHRQFLDTVMFVGHDNMANKLAEKVEAAGFGFAHTTREKAPNILHHSNYGLILYHSTQLQPDFRSAADIKKLNPDTPLVVITDPYFLSSINVRNPRVIDEVTSLSVNSIEDICHKYLG